MEIRINRVKNFSKKEQTIIIREKDICLTEGNSCYEKVLSQDIDFICDIENRLSKIMFGWKDEYVGGRTLEGEKYHIVVDINHKKRKYKIQNKFPSNWDEFLKIENEIFGGDNYE